MKEMRGIRIRYSFILCAKLPQRVVLADTSRWFDHDGNVGLVGRG